MGFNAIKRGGKWKNYENAQKIDHTSSGKVKAAGLQCLDSWCELNALQEVNKIVYRSGFNQSLDSSEMQSIFSRSSGGFSFADYIEMSTSIF